MAAPAGNRFWEFRSKHGRDKLFSDAELLWKESVKYFTWCENNPLIEIDYRGKDAVLVEIPKVRAFTIKGLCLFLHVNEDFMLQFRNTCAGRDDQESKDFSRVISNIYDTIFTQKFTAAAAGFLKENLIARETGLAERQQVHQINQNASDYIEYTEVSDEALKEIKNANKRLKSNS
jgi:hypothetical protein